MAASAYSSTDIHQHDGSNSSFNRATASVDLRANMVVRRPAVTRNVGVAKGNGEGSYARNSQSQAAAVQQLVSYVEDAVDSMRLPNGSSPPGPLVIVDLGCASGSNTLKNVDVIVNRLQGRFEQSSIKKPEVAVFFNDLPSNDFNSLFLLVAEDNSACNHQQSSTDPADARGKYFAAGVPGSFYSRLFPKSFVNIFFSSFCLHWLSKVPDAVLDKMSPAYNKDSCWIQDGTAEVVAAYREQSNKDLTDFLRYRAEELHSGGLLILLFVGRKNSAELIDDKLFGEYWRLMDLAFQSLVSEGILSEEQKNTFNVPTYTRSLEEVSEVLQTFSSEFLVKKMELFPIFHFADYMGRLYKDDDPKVLAKKVLLMLKVTKEPLVEAHIGPALSKIYWDRCCEILMDSDLVDKFYARASKPEPLHQILLVLERK